MSDSECLLITVPEAAKLLAISPRNLWTLTKTGIVPCVRLGSSVRYSVEDLRTTIANNRTKTHC